MQYGPTATKALGAAGKASAEFIKAKGLDVANKVLGNPATLAGGISAGSDFISSALVPGPYEPSPAGAAGYVAGEIKDGLPKMLNRGRK